MGAAHLEEQVLASEDPVPRELKASLVRAANSVVVEEAVEDLVRHCTFTVSVLLCSVWKNGF